MDFGIVLDLETTGLNAKKDKIIEIGILGFQYDGIGKSSIVSTYGAVEDPEIELSEEIVKLTGLTNSALAGQKIDWTYVRAIMDKASVVIAHNAEFDSGFLKMRPELEGVSCHWACSVNHIDWKAHGFRTRALNYLAADHGFVNPFAHRAVFDCATTFRLIEPYFPELIEKSYERSFRVLARQSPFETKDILRTRGYRWNPEERVWFIDLLESNLEAERKFLADEVYRGAQKQEEVPLPSLDD